MDGRWIEDADFPTFLPNAAKLRSLFMWDLDSPHFGRAGPNREFYLDHEVAQNMRLDMDTRDALQRCVPAG